MYHGTVSPRHILHFGVPQGGVLSPDFFSFFTDDQPSIVELHVAFADDSYDAESSVAIDDAADRLTVAMTEIDSWATEKRLLIAPEKSSISLFTPDKHQSNYHPQVFLAGNPLKLDKNPTILGVKFDTHYTFNSHAINRVKKF